METILTGLCFKTSNINILNSKKCFVPESILLQNFLVFVLLTGRSWQVVAERMTAWHSWHRPDTRPRPWRRSPRPRLASRTVSSLQVFTTTQSWSWEIRSHDRPDPGRLEGRGSHTTQLRWCWRWWSAEDDDLLKMMISRWGWSPCPSPPSWPCRWSWCWRARSCAAATGPGCCSRSGCSGTSAGSAAGPRPAMQQQLETTTTAAVRAGQVQQFNNYGAVFWWPQESLPRAPLLRYWATGHWASGDKWTMFPDHPTWTGGYILTSQGDILSSRSLDSGELCIVILIWSPCPTADHTGRCIHWEINAGE